MKAALLKTFAVSFVGASMLQCTTSKKDVKDEWEDVSEERAEAEKETRDYAEERKEKFQEKSQEHIEKLEEQNASLRAKAVQATGEHKRELTDRVWELERQLTDAKRDLNALKNKGPVSTEDEMEALDTQLAEMDSLVKEANRLSH